VCGDALTTAGSRATFQIANGPANGLVLVAIGFTSNPTPITATEILVPAQPLAALVTFLTLDANGRLRVPLYGGSNTPTLSWVFQGLAFDGANWDLSNGVQVTFGMF